MQEQVRLIARKLAGSAENVFFTGAGISTESGIADYRGQGGLWKRFTPITIGEFMASKPARVEYWRRKVVLCKALAKARPNAAHLALFRLFQMGKLSVVITQNIDGLHQDAGMPDDRVVELHGNTRRVRCMGCGGLSPLEDALARIEAGDTAPECTCGGFLKPDTISFGQAMPRDAVRRAAELSSRCGVFTIVGSTLLVHPAADMPLYAKQGGAFLALVNLSETPCDRICDVVIREKAGRVLAALADAVATARP